MQNLIKRKRKYLGTTCTVISYKRTKFRVEPTFDQHSQYKMNHTVKGLHLRYNFSIIKHRTEEEERFTKKYQARQIVLDSTSNPLAKKIQRYEKFA